MIATATDRLRAWILSQNPAIDAASLTNDVDLIDGRIISSLQLVELILFLEEETGRTILVEDLDPETLRTIDRIAHHHLGDLADNEAAR